MNIIWNKEECLKIKTMLKKFNLTINKDEEITSSDYKFDRNSFMDEFTLKKLIELFYYQDKEEIYKILKHTIPVRYIVKKNKYNQLCNGLLMNLSNINPKDASEIFTIFNEISFQYSRVVSKVTDKIFVSLKDIKLIKKEIERIKNSNVETIYEIKVRNTMDKILNCVYGIDKFYIFKELIEYNNSKIKDLIVEFLEKRVSRIEKSEENKNNKVINDYGFEISGRIIKEKQRKARYTKK